VSCTFELSIEWRPKDWNKLVILKIKVMQEIRNRVQLIGNLGKAPEIHITEKGKKLARFSIATNDTYHNASGAKVKETTWHNVIAWGKLAEIVEKYLTKGKEVVLAGKLVYRNYNDKDGIGHRITEIVLNELVMMGGGARYENEPEEEQLPVESEMES
jgi:single-strand DNA-binding protein